MENLVIYLILAAVILLALGSTIRHFRGQGGCCGGGSSYRPKKKKLARVVATKVFVVDGMHCERCSGRVMEVINDILHASASVHLKTGEVEVSYEELIPDENVCAAIVRAGYTVREIRG